jgi:hypothetical protein
MNEPKLASVHGAPEQAKPILSRTQPETPLDKSVKATPVTYDSPRAKAAAMPERSGGGCNIGCSCRQLGCLFLLAILIVIGLFIVMLVRRPPVLWEPFKTVMNRNGEPQTLKQSANLDEIVTKLEQNGLADSGLTLTEDELAWLIQARIEREVQADITPQQARIFINMAENEPQPLWLIIDLQVGPQKQPVVTKIGTGLINAPEFLTANVNNLIQRLLTDTEGDTLINSIINTIGSFKVKELQLEEGKLTLKVELNLRT